METSAEVASYFCKNATKNIPKLFKKPMKTKNCNVAAEKYFNKYIKSSAEYEFLLCFIICNHDIKKPTRLVVHIAHLRNMSLQ